MLADEDKYVNGDDYYDDDELPVDASDDAIVEADEYGRTIVKMPIEKLSVTISPVWKLIESERKNLENRVTMRNSELRKMRSFIATLTTNEAIALATKCLHEMVETMTELTKLEEKKLNDMIENSASLRGTAMGERMGML